MKNQIIAIGALGGSGTRAVAEVFIKAGLYMGDELNGANDNLLFTRLFKNPDWYRTSSIEEKRERFKIFEKYMRGDNLRDEEYNELNFAANNNSVFKKDINLYASKLKSLYANRQRKQNWGWKEPNSYILLPELLAYFPSLRYIHVLRHGLDMAFSANMQQLNNWGWKYNIRLNGDEDINQLAVKQLDFWIESTKDVLSTIKDFKKNAILLNHSTFCKEPKSTIDNLLAFCSLNLSSDILDDLYIIPKNIGSNNRYKNYDLSIFSPEQLEFVNEMGFEVR